jgi:hypothetical protein
MTQTDKQTSGTLAIPQSSARLVWGTAGEAALNLLESGDQFVVAPFPGGALVSVVDGLGHGPEAAKVGKLAAATIETHCGQPVSAIMQQCHTALRRTRGVVMSLAAIHPAEGKMTWLGVGNVETTLIRQNGSSSGNQHRESLMLRGGVVGYNIPTLRPRTYPLHGGDLLIFVTDGIRSGFTNGQDIALKLPFYRQTEPQAIADHILEDYGRGTDDALVLVVRYLTE